MLFWTSVIFIATFSWTVDVNMQMSELMMSHVFCSLKWQISHIFSNEKVKLAFISTLNKCRIMSALMYFWYGDMYCCYMFEQKKWKFSKFLVYKIHGKLWGDEIICIFISTVQENNVSVWKLLKIQNVISSLFFIRFTSNFHRSIRNVLLFLSN